MKWIDYREKLGIGFNDSEKKQLFKNKITNRLTSFFQTLSEDIYSFWEYGNITETYFTEIGEAIPFQASLFHIADNVSREDSVAGIISKYVAFLNIIKREKTQDLFEVFFGFIKKSFDELKIEYEIVSDSDGVFFFPKGAKELDDALVSEPLEWLADYPTSRVAWVKALKEYSNQTDENASDIADKFRKALEAFFQEFFGGSRSLEKYIEDHTYEKYLDSQGVAQELRDELKNTVSAYTKFINNNAKHHDKTSQNVLEYLMYQTGNIMRLLITLK